MSSSSKTEVNDEKSSASPGELLQEREPALASNGNIIDDGLQRGLKNRHLQMIAFGGVVGASIWYGTGSAISYSGPAGALICFLVVGVDVFFVMQSLGEMATLFPIQGAFIELAGRFVDPALAFALGVNYWYAWVTNIANDYNNISLIMGLWTRDAVPSYAWILIFWAAFQGSSLLGIVVYGEMEFWLACWKLVCVVGGFLVAILVNTGAIGGEYIGFRYWRDPGAIANGINGFGKTFVLAAVYYSGTEMLALTAAESRNPRRDLPKAIRQTFWRILIIFLGLVFFAGIIVPYNDSSLLTATSKSAQSPWTVALVHAGWAGGGNLVNVVMITAQLSSVNSAIYVASRSLVALAANGRAPALFARTTANGVPVNAIVFSNLLGLLALLNVAATPGKVFSYLVSISGAATFIAWAFIGVTHVRLRRAWALQGRGLDELPYRASLYPYGAWLVVVLNLFLVFVSGYEVFVGGFAAVDFVFSYVVVAIFAVLYFGWKLVKKTTVVKLAEADLVTGRRDYLLPAEGEGEGEGEGAGEESGIPWYVVVKRVIFS
ncbi:amino acid permease/ SLC12A domain-containing protein [Daldinia caldariorum]|uniref:amino acid permease/ SLC12A domain-containing protein n=1 Tax=Daldinia caldariorum TaxID=326644 RepID=UPI0020084952|nr:amino acid permease/ SLC12A domain-containing protein [Daldinia caldariorum]KAI1472907.1 amino acid permease/ SLC12A domain-containing protein [Daldinia caldariorum]